MKEAEAVRAFGAMSQETRLRIVRRLVVKRANGLPAGEIGDALGGVSSSRLSFYLNHLEHAGLLEKRRQGRSIVYSAIFPVLADLVAFLMHDCCDGHCAYCNKAIELFAQCEGRPTSPGTVDSKI